MSLRVDDMNNVTEADIGQSIMGLVRAIDAEYETMTQEDLEERWFFKFDPDRSVVWNMYKFHDYLTLFAGSCRRWEERHNGSCCVVERVRDTYIIPKIKEFEKTLRDHLSNQ